jgi:ATP-dependent DNA helicase RecG
MLELANDRGLQDWELLPVRGTTLEDIDIEKVEAYLQLRSMRSRQAGRFEDMERVLLGMKCAVRTGSGEVVPTNAGLLFFGREPQMSIIQSDAACVLYRDAVGASRYVDRKFVTGTIQELIDGTEAFLNRYIAVGARIEGWKRIDLPEYSSEVLREAVVNAVVHRDYSKRGESIRVFYYADRVEVGSPGLLLPGVTVEQMEKGVVQSKLRNPVLVNLLRDVPGYMERLGSGIKFMLDETKRLGLPAPEFREVGEFVVTFRRSPALAPPQPEPQYRETLWDEDEQLRKVTPVENLPAEQESRLVKAVQYVNENGFITNSIYRELTRVSDRTASRDLETLVERGRLKSVGRKGARRYVLP